MGDLTGLGTGLGILSACIWLGLLTLRGGFWRARPRLEVSSTPQPAGDWPTIWAVIPARNEASLLPATLRSLLQQDYPGRFEICLVDDQSTDETQAVALQVATSLGKDNALRVITTPPLPPGWSGKLWAMHTGIQTALEAAAPQEPDYFLLTDADIFHDPDNLRSLVSKAQAEQLDLVSLMVLLRCKSLWERLLIPAFVFFFQKLYPFAWVNRRDKAMAAAAGGCILVRAQVLAQAGGIEVIRSALIDDCALAAAIQSTPDPATSEPHRGIWLGLTTATRSLRPYEGLGSIWSMVARTAYTQLDYSPGLLVGAVLGMILVYLAPPLLCGWGLLVGKGGLAISGLIPWASMTLAYLPTLRLYQLSPLWAITLPGVALLYNLMTLDSARRHWQGKGGAWKGRVYPMSGEDHQTQTP
ncbi:MAG: glycosyltransferase [Acaryochloridaceae cyanobacterium SU_2_1]|nr:glycosyltransferase [Acaryochloridaceae cyanobacterium SU_2_1]